MLVRKTVHVSTRLSNDDLGNTPVDSGRAIKSIDGFLIFLQQIFDVRIQFGDLSSKESNVRQQLFEDNFVMAAQVSTQGFFQLGDFGAKAPLGQLSQFLGIVSAARQLLQHLNGGSSGNVGDDALKLDVRAFKRFCNSLAA